MVTGIETGACAAHRDGALKGSHDALGFDAEYLESVPLVGRPGVRFAHRQLLAT